MVFVRDGEGSFATKGTYGGNRWFISCPQFIGGYTIGKGGMRDNVLDKSGMLEGIGPSSMSNIGFSTLEHGNTHSYQGSIDTLSHAILLWCIGVGLFMNDAGIFQVLNEFS